MIEICKQNKSKNTLNPNSLAHFHLTNYDVINAYCTYAVFGMFRRNKS